MRHSAFYVNALAFLSVEIEKDMKRVGRCLVTGVAETLLSLLFIIGRVFSAISKAKALVGLALVGLVIYLRFTL